MQNYQLLIVATTLLRLGGVMCATEEEMGSPLRVAQCRAKCIFTFGKMSAGFDSCIKESDCFMCWEKCQLLESNFVVWGSVCSKSALCGDGCQLACQFHKEGGGQRVPVQVTQGQQVISRAGVQVTWPRPRAQLGAPFIYVVMRQRAGEWRQLQQTMDLTARVPVSGGLRVLVVGREGLVTIYSPQATLSAAEEVVRRVSKEALLALRLPSPSNSHINTQLFSEPSQNPLDMLKDVDTDEAWNLRELSLIHQKVLVIAEIAWNPQSSKKTPAVYLVTWEVDGGGIRGNLFTDTTSVTLSLWPDRVYHIQVQLVRHDWKQGSQSEQLVLDTHTGHTPELLGAAIPAAAPGVSVRSPPLPPPHVPVLAGLSASVFTFLLVMAVFSWRLSRRPLNHTKLSEESSPSHSHIYQVYPPAVRLDMSTLRPAEAAEPIPSVCGGTSVHHS